MAAWGQVQPKLYAERNTDEKCTDGGWKSLRTQSLEAPGTRKGKDQVLAGNSRTRSKSEYETPQVLFPLHIAHIARKLSFGPCPQANDPGFISGEAE